MVECLKGDAHNELIVTIGFRVSCEIAISHAPITMATLCKAFFSALKQRTVLPGCRGYIIGRPPGDHRFFIPDFFVSIADKKVLTDSSHFWLPLFVVSFCPMRTLFTAILSLHYTVKCRALSPRVISKTKRLFTAHAIGQLAENLFNPVYKVLFLFLLRYPFFTIDSMGWDFTQSRK